MPGKPGRLTIAVCWAALVGLRPVAAQQQGTTDGSKSADSVVMAANPGYSASWLHRKLFGGHYRELWKAPIAVPVLDLHRFAGGLRPDKISGGLQTRSLRFRNPQGLEFVFRPVRKDSIAQAKEFHGTVVEGLLRDLNAAGHPAGAILADPLLTAAGVLHPHPRLYAMPDDPALEQFQKEFANRLGMMEEYPNVPDSGTGFAGARRIIDSEDLLKLLNKDPGERVDARAFLRARLMDMLMNDWDRHPGQWKWGQGGRLGEEWQPISRDRDRAFISYSGLLPSLSRMMVKNATPFRAGTPKVSGLIYNSREFDRRILLPLEKPVWDSVARDLIHRVTDSVIDLAYSRLPQPYQDKTPTLVGMIRVRRDSLARAADEFFEVVNRMVEIHATDAGEEARVERHPDGTLDVELRTGNRVKPWFARSFHPAETGEVRLYLHGGDDRAVITGSPAPAITLRVIGGNGNNTLIDSSGASHLYDAGKVSGIGYGPDTLFNRRPWITRFGEPAAQGPDYGGRFAPLLGLGYDHDLGLIGKLGVAFYRFGFRKRPYASRFLVEVEHASRLGKSGIAAQYDQRMEDSPLHWSLSAGMTKLAVLQFHGFGNSTVGGSGAFYEVDQRQWSVWPALGVSLGTRSDVSLGPVIKYSTMDEDQGPFITATRPYGFGDFGQAGARLVLRVDERDDPYFPVRGIQGTVQADLYPAGWDVRSTFGSIRAVAMGYHAIQVPLRPVLAVRIGAQKVFGDFPFHESAFLGGGPTVRNLTFQRYAGDTEVDATTELRVRVGRVPLVLPFDLGVFGLYETGRVYVDGESPGGWRSALGGGVWIGLPDPSKAISISFTDGDFNRVFVRAGLTF
jgi:hypothetical protein